MKTRACIRPGSVLELVPGAHIGHALASRGHWQEKYSAKARCGTVVAYKFYGKTMRRYALVQVRGRIYAAPDQELKHVR